jgi:hypothetical protein
MKPSALSLLALFTLAFTPIVQADDGWISLFNGKDLTGWKSNASTEEQADTKKDVFTVVDGQIKISGGRSHLFYVGPVNNANFKNFELKAKVMTLPGANSGIYFHTAFQEQGWPSKGFECQVNATHTDPKKTGGLYAVVDVMNNAPNKDNVWFDYDVKVDGKHVVLMVDGKVTAEWTQPDNWVPPKGMPGRVLGEGTFALQGHDPKSTTYYKDIFVKPLP